MKAWSHGRSTQILQLLVSAILHFLLEFVSVDFPAHAVAAVAAAVAAAEPPGGMAGTKVGRFRCFRCLRAFSGNFDIAFLAVLEFFFQRFWTVLERFGSWFWPWKQPEETGI